MSDGWICYYILLGGGGYYVIREQNGDLLTFRKLTLRERWQWFWVRARKNIKAVYEWRKE